MFDSTIPVCPVCKDLAFAGESDDNDVHEECQGEYYSSAATEERCHAESIECDNDDDLEVSR